MQDEVLVMQVASLAQALDASPSPETDQPPSAPLTLQEKVAAKVLGYYLHCLPLFFN